MFLALVCVLVWFLMLLYVNILIVEVFSDITLLCSFSCSVFEHLSFDLVQCAAVQYCVVLYPVVL